MKKENRDLWIVSSICLIIGAVIFVAYTLKLTNIENQNTMWATGGLAMMALGAGFVIYLFGRKS
jgi:dipeptide/tripeptide permease